jgi:hypothetical protein
MEMSGHLHAPASLPLGETVAGTRYIGGCVGPKGGLDVESNPNFSVVQALV